MAGPGVISFTRTEKYSSHMSEELTQIRKERLFTDFKITVNKHVMPCHKVMVAAHSPVLKALLTSDMVEAAKHAVSLNHLELDAMKAVLDYMYSGQVSIHAEQLMDVMKACDYLQIQGLMEQCVEEVPTVLQPRNVLKWLDIAQKFSLAEVKSSCEKLMVSDFVDVSKEAGFLAMDYQGIQDYFSDVCSSNVDRDQVLYAAMRWVEDDSENRVEHLENLLEQVQLCMCSIKAILEVMEAFRGIVLANESVYSMLTKALKQISTPSEQTEVVQQENVKHQETQSSTSLDETQNDKATENELETQEQTQPTVEPNTKESTTDTLDQAITTPGTKAVNETSTGDETHVTDNTADEPTAAEVTKIDAAENLEEGTPVNVLGDVENNTTEVPSISSAGGEEIPIGTEDCTSAAATEESIESATPKAPDAISETTQGTSPQSAPEATAHASSSEATPPEATPPEATPPEATPPQATPPPPPPVVHQEKRKKSRKLMKRIERAVHKL